MIEATADVARACLVEPDQWRESAVASTIDRVERCVALAPNVARFGVARDDRS